MQTQAKFGIWWVYNVTTPNGPLKEYGRVYYVTNDFGNLVMIDSASLVHSLA